MAFLPRSSEEEEEGSWPSNSPGSPWKPDASNQVKSLWDDQDIQVSSQKPRPPSITVETTDINEVESGELRWPPEELLLSDSEEEEDEAFFQDQDEESGWAWCPLDPRSSLRTLNPGSDWEEEEETWGESDTSWISGTRNKLRTQIALGKWTLLNETKGGTRDPVVPGPVAAAIKALQQKGVQQMSIRGCGRKRSASRAPSQPRKRHGVPASEDRTGGWGAAGTEDMTPGKPGSPCSASVHNGGRDGAPGLRQEMEAGWGEARGRASESPEPSRAPPCRHPQTAPSAGGEPAVLTGSPAGKGQRVSPASFYRQAQHPAPIPDWSLSARGAEPRLSKGRGAAGLARRSSEAEGEAVDHGGARGEDQPAADGAEKEAVQAAPGAETGAAAAAPGGRGGGGRGAHYAPPSQEAGVQCPGQHHPIWEEEKETFATDQACPEGEGCHGSGSPPEARQDH